MAFGSFHSQGAAPMADINTTPLVDVMLVLLVVFIVTAPLLTNAVPIQLPREAAVQHQDKPEAIRLAVDAEGKMFWDDKPVDAASLEKRFADAVRVTPEIEVHVRADKAARYEQVAEVMASAQRGGVAKIGFVTEAPATTR